MTTLLFRHPRPADAVRCHQIETQAYEGDEAATLEKIALRIAHYPEGFLVLESAGRIIGFINSGCAHDVALADDAFKELKGHDPEAPNAVILSLVVDPDFQGRGHARRLMERFVADMKQAGKQRIHLMCREHHIPMYEAMGYTYLHPSASDHGGLVWHEMKREL